MLQFLIDIFTRHTIVYIITCREQHADLNYHFHAFVATKDKFNITSVTALDFHGKHPNFTKPRTPDNVITYIKKGGDILEHGFWIAKEDKRRQKN